MTRETYPTGWGWHPKAPLGGPTPDDLPDLPFLRMLGTARKRNDAIVKAIDSVPGLRQVITPKHIAAKYGLRNTQAWELLHVRKPCAT